MEQMVKLVVLQGEVEVDKMEQMMMKQGVEGPEGALKGNQAPGKVSTALDVFSEGSSHINSCTTHLISKSTQR